MIQDKCDAIDLNLGCPQAIAKKGFYGSFLQDEWDLIHDMISTLHINLRIPVCAKIRIFKDRQKTLAYAKHVCSAGVSILTVHGRTREMKGQFTGLADWDMIREIRQVIPKDVVMFANGNIQFHGDVERCIEYTGVDGVMSADGHLHNPGIFVDPADVLERRHNRVDKMAREYLEIVKELNDPASTCVVKSHMFQIFRVSFEKHKDLRTLAGSTQTIENWQKIVDEMERRIEMDLEKEPEVENGVVPWYRCQPYIRPDHPPQPAVKEKSVKEKPTGVVASDTPASIETAT